MAHKPKKNVTKSIRDAEKKGKTAKLKAKLKAKAKKRNGK